MKQLKLTVTKRAKSGTSESKRNRAEGLIPAVIYGKSGSHPVIVTEKDFRTTMRQAHGSAALLQVTDNDSVEKLCVVQNVSRHPLTDKILHVDLHEISQHEPMTTHIPVHTVGEPVGVTLSGGVFELSAHQLDIRCLPKHLPEYVSIDISKLSIGDAIHLKDLDALEGVTFLGDEDMTIASCHQPQKIEETEESEAAAEATPSEENKEESAEEAKA